MYAQITYPDNVNLLMHIKSCYMYLILTLWLLTVLKAHYIFLIELHGKITCIYCKLSITGLLNFPFHHVKVYVEHECTAGGGRSPEIELHLNNGKCKIRFTVSGALKHIAPLEKVSMSTLIIFKSSTVIQLYFVITFRVACPLLSRKPHTVSKRMFSIAVWLLYISKWGKIYFYYNITCDTSAKTNRLIHLSFK